MDRRPTAFGSRWSAAALATALWALGPYPAHAQSILQGTVTSGTTGLPVATVVVAATGPGDQQASALTTATGTFRMEIPAGGVWALAATHIGFQNWTGEVDVASGASIEIAIVLDIDPIAMEDLRVLVERHCRVQDDPERTVAVLLEARRAFLSSDRQPATMRYERRVDEMGVLNAKRVDDPWDQPYWVHSVSADSLVFRTAAPLEDLSIAGDLEAGFVRESFRGGQAVFSYDFLAPTIELLLSDDFLERHCFEAVEGESSVGLEFIPSYGRTLAYDVRGTLWLPLDPDAFPSIDFHYTAFPETPTGDALESYTDAASHRRDVQNGLRDSYPRPRQPVEPDNRFGGRIELSPVAGVGWIPHRVEIRYPLVQHRDEYVQPRSSRTREAWIVTNVRRTTYRLLRGSP